MRLSSAGVISYQRRDLVESTQSHGERIQDFRNGGGGGGGGEARETARGLWGRFSILRSLKVFFLSVFWDSFKRGFKRITKVSYYFDYHYRKLSISLECAYWHA